MGEVIMTAPNDRTEGSKVIRVVEYLIRLASLRTKTVRDVGEYQNLLWINDIPKQKGCFTQAWGRDENLDPDVWIEVQSQREPKLPSVPTVCQDWTDKSSLWNKSDIPDLLPQIARQFKNPAWQEDSDRPEFLSRTEHLDDHPEVQEAWDRYIEGSWLSWVEAHNEWERVHNVYARLFAIRQEQLRLGEEYELVLGLGLLTWRTRSGQHIRRHMVVSNAVLEFEARLVRFTVRPLPDGANVRPEMDMIDIEDQPARAEATAKASLHEASDDPWDRNCVEGVLQALVHSIDSRGEYDSSLEAKPIRASDKPIVEYAPALILRKRSARGLTETLEKIKEEILNGNFVPDQFQDLAEIRSHSEIPAGSDPGRDGSGFSGEVFFPKPSNEEQRRIVEKIQAASGVLVQGPPGTGKSHTIANLICHLLATGQRTLITAKTPRALRVLEGLVPEELRPLCINLLGSGLEEKRSLESSVSGILRKNEDWDEGWARGDIVNLEQHLHKLREEKAEIDRRLRDIRESETHSFSIAEGTYEGTAARIAESVNRKRSDFDWFTDIAPLDKSCPVTESELRDLMKELRYFGPEKRQEMISEWTTNLSSPEYFEDLVESERRAERECETSSNGADKQVAAAFAGIPSASMKDIQDSLTAFSDLLRRLMTLRHSWMNDASHDIASGNASTWHALHRVTQATISEIEPLIAVANENTLEFPDESNVSVLFADACQLKAHLENGGTLGLWGPFRPRVVREHDRVLKTVRVNGGHCSNLQQLSVVVDVLGMRIGFEKAWGFWKGHHAQPSGPYLMQFQQLRDLSNCLTEALLLEEQLENCRESLRKCPAIRTPVWTDKAQIERLIISCRFALANYNKRRVVDEIRSRIEWPVMSIVGKTDSHPVMGDVLSAVRNRDVEEYKKVVNSIRSLEKEFQLMRKLDAGIERLRQSLPSLASQLESTCNDSDWDARIQHVREAWHWAQARFWVDDYIKEEDAPSLSRRVRQIENEIDRVTAQLAADHAWSFCFSRLGDTHRRHMIAWQQSMRRLGKGTGKHAPRHRREAQKHLNACREAVPAWVMPLHRVWDTVNPEPGIFDVVIVDEASQCGVEALPLFYLGKKVLVVGDDKQISPDAVGVPRDAVHRLMEEYLHDFRFKSSFDVESSLFDHGKLRYGTSLITLREHFRCMPEIIRFSNDLCYSDTPLVPLRQYGPDRLNPLEHVFMRRGFREGSGNRVVNRPEANALVERVVELCADERYSGKSMGVVVLQGNAQASLIEEQLLERLGAEQMERRRLVCGNPYSFQGDERDVMFLSMVAANNERIGPLNKAADERRFNVAVSRARDQVFLFHSVTQEDLSQFDLRRRLLQFFENTTPQDIAGINRENLELKAAQDNRAIIRPPVPFESWFEVDVALELVRENFNVHPQYKFAGKRIDLVVEGGGARLAVECDGDEWHGVDQYEADMQRQRQLERCGWEFFRVREAVFRANKKIALEKLWQALKERGIFPRVSGDAQGNAQESEYEQDDEDYDVNKEYYEEARRNLNVNLSLETFRDVLDHSGRCIGMESNWLFEDYSQNMVGEYGEWVRPYLAKFFRAHRDNSGSESFMSTDVEIVRQVACWDEIDCESVNDEELEEEYEEAVRKCKESGDCLSVDLFPDTFKDGVGHSAFRIFGEQGVQKFEGYSQIMVGELGQWVRPYLVKFYRVIRRRVTRYCPEFKSDRKYSMSTDEEIEQEVASWNEDHCDGAGNSAQDNDVTPPSSRERERKERSSSRRVETVSIWEIKRSIPQALSKCPNQSCTVDSMPSRVLKELGVLTRGSPRKKIEKRIIRSLSFLERQGIVDLYKAKNQRVRLTQKRLPGY